ncbi:MAG: helix-turn-helix domain-containing protein [Actinomycetia bacterium]|nr:helix-turn-helix domain-containing protein [Actinomycetes bacterium]
MDGAEDLGRLIRESRLKQGMSLGQLASAVGRSSSSVRRWERGEVAPAIGIVPELARVLDIDEGALRDLRPGHVEPGGESPTAEYIETSKPLTIEDAVSVADPLPADSSRPVEVEGDTVRPVGLVGDLRQTVFGQKDSWIGWARGLLTVFVLVTMLVILIWALGGLFEALGDVWDSFDAGG